MIRSAIKEATDSPVEHTRLATVTSTGPGGYLVVFDGESTASSRRYLTTGTYARVGDRVVMTRVGSTYVVTGVVTPGAALGVISRSTGYLTRLVSPGIGQYLSVHYNDLGPLVPAGAVAADIHWSWGAHAAANAACDWEGVARFHTTTGVGYLSDIMLATFTTHNEGNPALNIGGAIMTSLDVRPYIGKYFGFYTNCRNAAGSGAGIHPGWASWQITFHGYV